MRPARGKMARWGRGLLGAGETAKPRYAGQRGWLWGAMMERWLKLCYVNIIDNHGLYP